LYLYGNKSLQYEYKLGEAQGGWFTTQVNQNIVNLSNIKPGEYELKIRLKGATTEIAQYRLKIKPAFYQTTVFLLLVIIIVLALLILYFRIQRNRLMAEKNAVQSEQKLLRTQMNPHFIFNSLMAVQHFLLKNDSKSAARYLGKFSKLVRAILVNSTEELIPLEKEIDFLDNYLRLQKLRFEDSFNYTFIIDKDIPLELIKIPPMLTQPFIENAIEHGIKEEQSGEVKIRIAQTGNVLKMEVEDNGIGYLAGIEKNKDFKNHESKAIKITRERLNLLHKKQKNRIVFELFDLSEIGGKGTRVLFTIPLN